MENAALMEKEAAQEKLKRAGEQLPGPPPKRQRVEDGYDSDVDGVSDDEMSEYAELPPAFPPQKPGHAEEHLHALFRAGIITLGIESCLDEQDTLYIPEGMSRSQAMVLVGEKKEYPKLSTNEKKRIGDIKAVLEKMSSPLPKPLADVLKSLPKRGDHADNHHEFLTNLALAMVQIRRDAGSVADKFCEYMGHLQNNKDALDEYHPKWLYTISGYYALSKIWPVLRSEVILSAAPTDRNFHFETILRKEYFGEEREKVFEHTLRHIAHMVTTLLRVTVAASICLRRLASEFGRQPELTESQELEGGLSFAVTLGSLYNDIVRFGTLNDTAGHVLMHSPKKSEIRYDATKISSDKTFRPILEEITAELEDLYGKGPRNGLLLLLGLHSEIDEISTQEHEGGGASRTASRMGVNEDDAHEDEEDEDKDDEDKDDVLSRFGRRAGTASSARDQDASDRAAARQSQLA